MASTYIISLVLHNHLTGQVLNCQPYFINNEMANRKTRQISRITQLKQITINSTLTDSRIHMPPITTHCPHILKKMFISKPWKNTHDLTKILKWCVGKVHFQVPLIQLHRMNISHFQTLILLSSLFVCD